MPLQLVVKGFARDTQVLQGRLDIATMACQRLTYLLRLELLHAGGQAQVLVFQLLDLRVLHTQHFTLRKVCQLAHIARPLM